MTSTKTLSLPPPTTYFHLVMDRWSEPFWRAAGEHRLEIPRCCKCGRFRMPPSAYCATCQSQEVAWVQVAGTGTVYTYTIITNPPFAEAAAHVPYIPAVIELDDAPGARLISAIVGAPPGDVAIGSRVKVIWQDLPDGAVLPRFELATTA